jgi:hypothetical protein
MAVDTLDMIGTPSAYEELRRFASSQLGSDQDRMQVLLALSEAGQLHSDEPLRLWSSKRNEWTQIRAFLTRVGSVEPPRCHPKAMELVEKSGRALASAPPDQVPPIAIQHLEQAVKIVPLCPIALHNLGALYLRQGKREEGESLVRRSVEVDPSYLFGYATLAHIELQNDNLEACEGHLERVFTAPTLHPDVLERALICQAYLDIKKENPDGAEQALDLLKAMNSEFTGLNELELQLRLLRGFSGWGDRWLKDVHRYRLRQLKNPITAEAELRDCLDRVSRESLTATLRAWRLSTAGRKEAVIAGLVGAMTDPDWLPYTLGKTLSQEERTALRWLLDKEGVRPWAEFTDRFGSDFDESPYWQWHEPETVPGRLRMLGLLAVGTLEGDEIALIPANLRPLLREILETET